MKRHLVNVAWLLGFFGLWLLCSELMDVPANNPAVSQFFAEAVPCAAAIGLSALFCCFGGVQAERTKLLSSLKAGVLTGVLWFGLAELPLFAIGLFNIYDSNEVPLLWLWAASAVLTAVTQEVLVHGFAYRLIKAQYGTAPAAGCSVILFIAVHTSILQYSLLSVLNVVTMSLLMTLLTECFGGLAAPCAAHAVWNVLGGVVFGCMGTADSYPCLLKTHLFGYELLTGGKAGLECGLHVFLLNLSLIFAVLMYRRINKKEVAPFQSGAAYCITKTTR